MEGTTSTSGLCKSRGRSHDFLLPFSWRFPRVKTHRQVCYHIIMLFSFTYPKIPSVSHPYTYMYRVLPTGITCTNHKAPTMRHDKNKTEDLGWLRTTSSALAVRDHWRSKCVSAKNEEFTAFLPSLIIPTNFYLCYGTINSIILINSSIRLRTTVNLVHVPLRLIGMRMPRYNEGDRHVLAWRWKSTNATRLFKRCPFRHAHCSRFTQSPDGDNHLSLAVAISVGVLVSLLAIFARQAQGRPNFEMPNLEIIDLCLGER